MEAPSNPDVKAGPQGIGLIYALIGAMALIEAAITLGPLYGLAQARSVALEYAGFWPGLLDNWRPNYGLQPWAMFLTYGFLHGGLIHFAVNMVTLYSLGRMLLFRVGPLKFTALYAASLLGGAIGFGLLAPDLRPMVGASGALFGLAGAFLAWEYLDRFSSDLPLWPVARAALMLLALNLVLWWAMDGLLAWQTHLGGFVTGWVAAMLLDPVGRA